MSLAKKYSVTTTSGSSPTISGKVVREIIIINDVDSTGRVFFGFNEVAWSGYGICISPGEHLIISGQKVGSDIYMCTDVGSAVISVQF